MRHSIRKALLLGLSCLGLLAAMVPAQASVVWTWDYSTAGVSASGSFTTADTADGQGFYQITGVTGQRNGVAITGLQPTGTPIPGNEPFAVDNLVSDVGDLLTADGFGFALADGTFATVFFASFLSPPGHMEFFSAPPLGASAQNVGPEDSELPVVFHASQTVPEPAAPALAVLALAALALVRRPAGAALSRRPAAA